MSPKLVVAIPIAVSAAFYAWKFFDLFPLIEYRQWIDPQPIDWWSHWLWFQDAALFHWSNAWSRTVPFLTAYAFAEICGYSIPCHNALHLLLLMAAALLLVRLLSAWVSPIIAASAVVFFLFSVPMLDAVAWQATLLDKCALLLTAAMTLYIARGQNVPTWRDQMVLLVFTFLTVNAKEASWVSLPACALLAFIRSGDLVRTAARFAVPAAYFGWQIGSTLVVIPAAEKVRLMSSDPLHNLSIYAGYLLGVSQPILTLVVLGAIVLAHVRPTQKGLLLWATAAFLAALAIPSRTTAPAPFYLLVPLFYLTILIALALSALSNSRVVTALASMTLIATQAANFVRHYPHYQTRIQLSRNFQSALASIRGQFEVSRPEFIAFCYPADQRSAYMFVHSPRTNAHALAAYIEPSGTSVGQREALRRRIRSAPADTCVGQKGEMLVLLRPDMSLDRLVLTP